MNKLLQTYQAGNNTVLIIIRGDITEEPCDAIVNAANSYLKHGGGVAGAIVRKGGACIQEESDKFGYVPVGSCVVTGAGRLPAEHVIHTVGPRWGEGDEEEKLTSAVFCVLKKADELKLTSITLPAVSGGIFGYPPEDNCKVILNTIKNYCETRISDNKLIIKMCLYDESTTGIFLRTAAKIFSTTNSL